MPNLKVPGATTTVTSYTIGSASLVVADTSVIVSVPSAAYPVYVAIYRAGTPYLMTVHKVIGVVSSTSLRTAGVATGYSDVALSSGDLVVPYVSTDALQSQAAPPVPGGLPYASLKPSDWGFAEWSFAPSALGTAAGATATNGTQYFAKYVPQVVTTVNNLAVVLGTAGTTPTAGDNWIGLFNSSGTQIALSADQVTAFATAGLICAAMVTPVTVTPGSTYYIGFVNTAGTAAKLLCATAVVTSFNLPFSGATLQYATNGTSKTTMDTSITVASNSVTNALAFWWGVNGTATS